jgi:hypothetical protein
MSVNGGTILLVTAGRLIDLETMKCVRNRLDRDGILVRECVLGDVDRNLSDVDWIGFVIQLDDTEHEELVLIEMSIAVSQGSGGQTSVVRVFRDRARSVCEAAGQGRAQAVGFDGGNGEGVGGLAAIIADSVDGGRRGALGVVERGRKQLVVESREAVVRLRRAAAEMVEVGLHGTGYSLRSGGEECGRQCSTCLPHVVRLGLAEARVKVLQGVGGEFAVLGGLDVDYLLDAVVREVERPQGYGAGRNAARLRIEGGSSTVLTWSGEGVWLFWAFAQDLCDLANDVAAACGRAGTRREVLVQGIGVDVVRILLGPYGDDKAVCDRLKEIGAMLGGGWSGSSKFFARCWSEICRKYGEAFQQKMVSAVWSAGGAGWLSVELRRISEEGKRSAGATTENGAGAIGILSHGPGRGTRGLAGSSAAPAKLAELLSQPRVAYAMEAIAVTSIIYADFDVGRSEIERIILESRISKRIINMLRNNYELELVGNGRGARYKIQSSGAHKILSDIVFDSIPLMSEVGRNVLPLFMCNDSILSVDRNPRIGVASIIMSVCGIRSIVDVAGWGGIVGMASWFSKINCVDYEYSKEEMQEVVANGLVHINSCVVRVGGMKYIKFDCMKREVERILEADRLRRLSI